MWGLTPPVTSWSLHLCSRRQLWFCTEKGCVVLLGTPAGEAGPGEGVARALSPGTWGMCSPGSVP